MIGNAKAIPQRYMTSMPLYPEIPAKSIRSFLSQPEHSWNFIDFVLIATFSPRPVISGSSTFFLLICALVLIIHDFFVRKPLNYRLYRCLYLWIPVKFRYEADKPYVYLITGEYVHLYVLHFICTYPWRLIPMAGIAFRCSRGIC